jgi:hypothetical protein
MIKKRTSQVSRSRTFCAKMPFKLCSLHLLTKKDRTKRWKWWINSTFNSSAQFSNTWISRETTWSSTFYSMILKVFKTNSISLITMMTSELIWWLSIERTQISNTSTCLSPRTSSWFRFWTTGSTTIIATPPTTTLLIMRGSSWTSLLTRRPPNFSRLTPKLWVKTTCPIRT